VVFLQERKKTEKRDFAARGRKKIRKKKKTRRKKENPRTRLVFKKKERSA